ncbi:MAG TPA: ferrochelatase [Caulobacterales bacterium]|nr:ferrochelatase [Caulobacterales bacterium]
MTRKIAVILFNLGGPDSLEAVRPFLVNLFSDRAIIDLPQPLRGVIARTLANRRKHEAQLNYAHMGGRSPILPETQAQARALEEALAKRMPDAEFKCWPAMRYWRPFIEDVARKAEAWGASEAVLAPLYPQYSSTTTGSSLVAWRKASALPASTVCCYPAGANFARAHADAILEAWRAGGEPANPRVIFSAHGLPLRVIERGDPYQWQVEQSVAAVSALLPADWDKRIAYQSRVGPLKWLEPSTLDELAAAGQDQVGVIVSPIAFVSEHIETLVELDRDYAQSAVSFDVPYYLRAKALGAAERFIDALAELVERACALPGRVQSESGGRICPAAFGLCPHRPNEG